VENVVCASRTGAPALALDAPLTTTQPGRPVFITSPPLPDGDYEISETPRDEPGGHWVLDQVRCGGRIVPPFSGPLQQTLTGGTGVACVFANRFVPNGRIRVRKVTDPPPPAGDSSR
jgi:hypothetical protein